LFNAPGWWLHDRCSRYAAVHRCKICPHGDAPAVALQISQHQGHRVQPAGRMASSSEVHAPNIIGKLPALPHAPRSS